MWIVFAICPNSTVQIPKNLSSSELINSEKWSCKWPLAAGQSLPPPCFGPTKHNYWLAWLALGQWGYLSLLQDQQEWYIKGSRGGGDLTNPEVLVKITPFLFLRVLENTQKLSYWKFRAAKFLHWMRQPFIQLQQVLGILSEAVPWLSTRRKQYRQTLAGSCSPTLSPKPTKRNETLLKSL